MPEKQAEETQDGEYEDISYHTFEAVNYDRTMRWTAGSGRIVIGKASQHTNTENVEGKILLAGTTVVVWKTNFRLTQH